MQFQPVQIRHMKEAHDVQRIAAKHVRIGQRDTALVLDEFRRAGNAARAVGKNVRSRGEAGSGLGLLFLQCRANDAGQVTHALGHMEVMLHEALDRGQARRG